MIIETRWTIRDGRLELGTAINLRSPKPHRFKKDSLERLTEDGLIDCQYLNLSLYFLENLIFKLFKIYFVKINYRN